MRGLRTLKSIMCVGYPVLEYHVRSTMCAENHVWCLMCMEYIMCMKYIMCMEYHVLGLSCVWSIMCVGGNMRVEHHVC